MRSRKGRSPTQASARLRARLVDRLAAVVATAFGAGLSPVAPGTMGSLVGLPLAWWSAVWPVADRAALWLALLGVGTWAAKVTDERLGTRDSSRIVIDEVVGIGVTAWTAGREWRELAAAFVLFRFFDILKPPPVRYLDSWSKRTSGWAGGFAVMADDLAAAAMGLAVLMTVRWLLSWS